MVAAGMVDEDTLRISQLYVHPQYQRRGIGDKLMGAAIRHFARAKKVVLEVEEKNPKGVSFYKRYGFAYPRKTMVKIEGYEVPCLVGELRLSNRRRLPRPQ